MDWFMFIVSMVGLLFFGIILALAHDAGRAAAYREWITRETEINKFLLEKKP